MMRLVINPNVSVLEPLDLENKLYLPTRQLYTQLSEQWRAIYQAVWETLLDIHTAVATAARQLYEHPTVMLADWYSRAAASAQHVYVLFTETALPKLLGYYQQFVAQATDLGRQTWNFLLLFYERPGATAATLARHVSEAINDGVHILQYHAGNLWTLVENTFLEWYGNIVTLLGLLWEQPVMTLQALYHYTLSALLDGYYRIVSDSLTLS